MVRLINKTAVNAAGSGIYDCVADIIYADRDFFSDFFESKRKPEKINRHYYLCHSNGTEFTLVSRFFRPEISRSFSGGTLFAVILFGANFSDFLHQLQNGIFLLLPYGIWILFALYLNIGIIVLNWKKRRN